MITAFKDMSKIINQAKQQYGQQVLELDFSSVKIFRFTQKIKTMVETKCKYLTVLKLVECELNSLEKLPDLDITGIDVSINKLKDADLQHLTKYKNLSMLNVGDNFISGFQAINILKKCTKLKDLQISGNEIQKLPNYHSHIFKQLKSLQYLDKLDKHGLPQPSVDSHSDDVISDLDYDEDDSYEYEDEEGEFFDQDEDEEDDSSEKVVEVRKARKNNEGKE